MIQIIFHTCWIFRWSMIPTIQGSDFTLHSTRPDTTQLASPATVNMNIRRYSMLILFPSLHWKCRSVIVRVHPNSENILKQVGWWWITITDQDHSLKKNLLKSCHGHIPTMLISNPPNSFQRVSRTTMPAALVLLRLYTETSLVPKKKKNDSSMQVSSLFPKRMSCSIGGKFWRIPNMHNRVHSCSQNDMKSMKLYQARKQRTPGLPLNLASWRLKANAPFGLVAKWMLLGTPHFARPHKVSGLFHGFPHRTWLKRLATALIHIIQHKGEITTSEPLDNASFLSTQEGSMTTQEPKKLQRW